MFESKVDLHYFNEIFQNSHYQDDFGWSNEWNREIEKWLSFASSFDASWYNSNKNRVNREKQRDEFLGECKALYYIGEKLGCKVIQMEPDGKGKHKLDFLFEDGSHNVWNVEVKSPSWRSVESKKIDREFPDSESSRGEAKRRRWEQPQYVAGGGGSISGKDAIEDSIYKSAAQFLKGENNMLIITPDMIEGRLAVSLSRQFKGDLVHESIKKYDTEQVISCVCILDTTLFFGKKEPQYTSVVIESFVSAISPEFPIKQKEWKK